MEGIVFVLSKSVYDSMLPPQIGGTDAKKYYNYKPGRLAKLVEAQQGQSQGNSANAAPVQSQGRGNSANAAQVQPQYKKLPIVNTRTKIDFTYIEPQKITVPAALAGRFHVVLEDGVMSTVKAIITANRLVDSTNPEVLEIPYTVMDAVVDKLYDAAAKANANAAKVNAANAVANANAANANAANANAAATAAKKLQEAYLSFMEVHMKVIPFVSTVSVEAGSRELSPDEINELTKDDVPPMNGGRRQRGGAPEMRKKLSMMSWYKHIKQKFSRKVAPGNSRAKPNAAANAAAANGASATPVQEFRSFDDLLESIQGHKDLPAGITLEMFLTKLSEEYPELALRLLAEKRVMDYENFLQTLATKGINESSIAEILAKIHAWKESFKDLHRNPILLDVLNKAFRSRTLNLQDMGEVSRRFIQPFRTIEFGMQQKEAAKETFEKSLTLLVNFVKVVDKGLTPTFDVTLSTSTAKKVHICYDFDSVLLFFSSAAHEQAFNIEGLKSIETLKQPVYYRYGETIPHESYRNWRDIEGNFNLLYQYEFINKKLAAEEYINTCWRVFELLATDLSSNGHSLRIINWYGSQIQRLYDAMNSTSSMLIAYAKSIIRLKNPRTVINERGLALHAFIQAMNEQLVGKSIFLFSEPDYEKIKTKAPFVDKMKPYIKYLGETISKPLLGGTPDEIIHVHDFHKIVVCLDEFLVRMVGLYDRSHPNHKRYYFNIDKVSLFQILYVRYIGSSASLQKEGAQGEYLQNEQVIEFLTFLTEKVTKDIPMMELARASMHSIVLRKYEELYKSTTGELKSELDVNLLTFIKLFIVEFYFRDSSIDEKITLAKNIHNNLNSEQLSFDEIEAQIKSTKPSFAFDPSYESSELIDRTITSIISYTDTSYDSYTKLMTWVLQDFHNYLVKDYTIQNMFDGIDPSNLVDYMLDTKEFVDEFQDILRDVSFKVATAIGELHAHPKLGGLKFNPPPGYIPPAVGGSNTYFVFKGRRYKVRKEGRKLVIKTKEGIVPLVEAKKIQRQYLKKTKKQDK